MSGLRADRAAVTLFAAVLVFGVVSSARAVDFGHYFDEPRQLTKAVRNSAKTGIFLPNYYKYGSLRYESHLLLAWAQTSWKRLTSGDTGSFAAAFRRIVNTPQFVLDARVLGSFVAYTTLLWVFFFVRECRRSFWEALLAASLAGLSWEFSYHSRWPVVDVFMGMLSVLMLWLLLRAWNHSDPVRKRRDLLLAAAAAGLAIGSKYSAATALMPMLMVFALVMPGAEAKRGLPVRLADAIKAGLTAFFAFVLATPGFLLHPHYFWFHFKIVHHSYHQPHFAHTMPEPLARALYILTYVAYDVFSRHPAAAAIGTAALLAGFLSIFRSADRKPAWLILGFSVPYLLVFMSAHIVFVRNFFVLIPLVAIVAARGFAAVYEKIPKTTYVRLPFAAAVAALVVFNAAEVWRTSETIVRRNEVPFAGRLVSYVASHSGEKTFLTAKVRRTWPEDTPMPGHVVNRPQNADIVIFWSDEVRSWKLWPSIERGYIRHHIGPETMNFDFYPEYLSRWPGIQQQLVILERKKAEPLGLWKDSSPDRTGRGKKSKSG